MQSGDAKSDVLKKREKVILKMFDKRLKIISSDTINQFSVIFLDGINGRICTRPLEIWMQREAAPCPAASWAFQTLPTVLLIIL